MTEQREFTRDEMKTQALLERIASLENEKADLRVDLTVYAQENARLNEKIKGFEDAEKDKSESSN